MHKLFIYTSCIFSYHLFDFLSYLCQNGILNFSLKLLIIQVLSSGFLLYFKRVSTVFQAGFYCISSGFLLYFKRVSTVFQVLIWLFNFVLKEGLGYCLHATKTLQCLTDLMSSFNDPLSERRTNLDILIQNESPDTFTRHFEVIHFVFIISCMSFGKGVLHVLESESFLV